MSLTTILPEASSSPAAPGFEPPDVSSDPRSLPEGGVQELARLFKLLADETRLKIIRHLMQSDELNVRTLCGMLAQSQPAVSHHLALLKQAGLIERRREGKHNFYRLVTWRCRAYLDGLFGARDGEVRRVQIENAVLTYGHSGGG